MPTMADGRENTIQAIHEVFSLLEDLELSPRFADGSYRGCAEPTVPGQLGWRDDVGGWRYSAKGRLDLPGEQAGSASFARQVRDALAANDWEPRNGFLGAIEGIQDTGDQWTVYADRRDLSVRASVYANRSLVLIDVFGPCLPTTKEQQKEYMRAETDKFDVGGDDL